MRCYPVLYDIFIILTEAENDASEDVALPGAEETQSPVAKSKGKQLRKKVKKSAAPLSDSPEIAIDSDIDTILAELGINSSEVTGVSARVEGENTTAWQRILQTNAACFNPDNEIKTKFGAEVLKESRAQVKTQGHSRKAAPAKLRPQHSLIAFHNGPPVPQKLILMNKLGAPASDPSSLYFEFEPSDTYDVLEMEYHDVVSTFDPENVAVFVQRCPFYPPALLQLSAMCEAQGEFQHAHTLVTRALQVFQASFHPDFDILRGSSRLPFSNPTNECFYRCLTKHAQLLGKKGCCRTALEISKLIFSLSPTDDAGNSLLLLDFYALRSEQYHFLLELAGASPFEILMARPNFAWSSALARFFLEQSSTNTPTTRSSSDIDSLPGLQLDSGASAATLLRRALLLFPETLRPLLEQGDKTQLSQSSWRNCLPAFDQLCVAYHNTSATDTRRFVDKLTIIYTQRCAALWTEGKVASWLQREAQRVATEIGEHKLDFKALCDIRAGAYAGRHMPEGIRLAERSDYTDDVPHVPEEFRRQQAAMAPRGNVNIPPDQRLDLDMNPLMAFFMSLLPWMQPVDPGEGPPPGPANQ
jgi:hypothetical protein